LSRYPEPNGHSGCVFSLSEEAFRELKRFVGRDQGFCNPDLHADKVTKCYVLFRNSVMSDDNVITQDGVQVEPAFNSRAVSRKAANIAKVAACVALDRFTLPTTRRTQLIAVGIQ
jgi:hypothetical protein